MKKICALRGNYINNMKCVCVIYKEARGESLKIMSEERSIGEIENVDLDDIMVIIVEKSMLVGGGNICNTTIIPTSKWHQNNELDVKDFLNSICNGCSTDNDITLNKLDDKRYIVKRNGIMLKNTEHTVFYTFPQSVCLNNMYIKSVSFLNFIPAKENIDRITEDNGHMQGDEAVDCLAFFSHNFKEREIEFYAINPNSKSCTGFITPNDIHISFEENNSIRRSARFRLLLTEHEWAEQIFILLRCDTSKAFIDYVLFKTDYFIYMSNTTVFIMSEALSNRKDLLSIKKSSCNYGNRQDIKREIKSKKGMQYMRKVSIEYNPNSLIIGNKVITKVAYVYNSSANIFSVLDDTQIESNNLTEKEFLKEFEKYYGIMDFFYIAWNNGEMYYTIHNRKVEIELFNSIKLAMAELEKNSKERCELLANILECNDENMVKTKINKLKMVGLGDYINVVE